MKSLRKLSDLADKFEAKLAKYGQAPAVSQQGTTELFFGDVNKQRAFAIATSKGTAKVAKFLLDAATKSQKTTSFDLKAIADPKKGASWVVNVNPSSLQSSVIKLLDDEFKKVTGKSMTEAQAIADKAAKIGHGSGTLNIANFTADMG